MDRDTTTDMDMNNDQEITTNDGVTTTTTSSINHHGIYSKFGMWCGVVGAYCIRYCQDQQQQQQQLYSQTMIYCIQYTALLLPGRGIRSVIDSSNNTKYDDSYSSSFTGDGGGGGDGDGTNNNNNKEDPPSSIIF